MRKALLAGIISAAVICTPVKAEILSTPDLPENISHVNQVVAEHMYEKCLPGIEQVTLYLTSKDQLLNITRIAGYSYVSVDQEMLEQAIRTENYLIGDHCHSWSFELYLKEISEKRKENQSFNQARQNILENGPKLARQRSVTEIPSFLDMDRVLKDTLVQYRLNPQGVIRKRIYIIEEGVAPRVISFGLQKDKEDSYKALVKDYLDALATYEKYEQDFPRTALPHEIFQHLKESITNHDDARSSYLSSYEESLNKYLDERCRPESTQKCIEPSYKEFFDKINGEGTWRIEDLGYVQIKRPK